MEDPQAEFVGMLMDRLHALEGAVQQVYEDNAGLKAGLEKAQYEVAQLKEVCVLKPRSVHYPYMPNGTPL